MEEGAVTLAGEEESDEEEEEGEEGAYGDAKLGLGAAGAASRAAGLDLSGKGGCG